MPIAQRAQPVVGSLVATGTVLVVIAIEEMWDVIPHTFFGSVERHLAYVTALVVVTFLAAALSRVLDFLERKDHLFHSATAVVIIGAFVLFTLIGGER